MKRITVVLVFSVLAIFVFTGCGVLTMYNDKNPDGTVLYNGQGEKNDRGVLAAQFIEESKKNPDYPVTEVKLYYQNEKGFLIPVRRSIRSQEGIANACLSALINYPVTQNEIRGYGLLPVLPEDLKILGLNVKNTIAYVDFNDMLLNPASFEQEKNMIASVVYTLTAFDTISGVSFMVNGKEMIKMPFGTDISGVLTRDNVMINSDKINITQGYSKFDAYMWINDSYDNKWCIPVSREVEVMGIEDQAFFIFDAMKIETEELKTSIPINTRLEACEYDANTVLLDFNGNLLNYTGLDKEQEIISQIYLAAKQIAGIDIVIIRSQGKKVKLKEGTNISSGLFLCDGINRIYR